jgi:NAD(P)H-dependent FMN reductase
MMSEDKKAEGDIFVVGISGSLRSGSYTHMAVEIALQGAVEVGVRTKLLHLGEYELEFCDGRDDKDSYSQDVLKLRQAVAEAQGIILGTPEYHGGFSGVLKNAIDLMGFNEFAGKMVGLVGVSGGVMGATNALNSLRNIGRALHAWLIPEQVSIPQAWKVFDEAGNINDSNLEKRLKEVGRNVARFAFLHSSEQAQEFMRAWEGAPLNPGG